MCGALTVNGRARAAGAPVGPVISRAAAARSLGVMWRTRASICPDPPLTGAEDAASWIAAPKSRLALRSA